MAIEHLSLAEARRLALAAQGFAQARPRRPVTAARLAATIRALGLLQLDYVNVLVPAHYLVPFSRLGPYPRTLLDDLVYRRREFTEQWAHEASIVPVDLWPLLAHRRESFRIRPYGFEAWMAENPSYVDWAIAEVARRGPLSAEELTGADKAWGRLQHSWYGRIERAVLEAHFCRGRLAVAARRQNFARLYDLAERVIAPEHYNRRMSAEEAQRELLLRAARAYGVGLAADLADYYRMPVSTARLRLGELVAAGLLREVRVEGWRETAYLHPQARLPRRACEASALLSPFDPVVWFRARASRLFGFDYRIEIYTPQAERKWGYYVLPFLLGERLAARVDLKADRKARRLLLLSAYVEDQAEPGEVASALARELREVAAWLGLNEVSVERRSRFERLVAAALRS